MATDEPAANASPLIVTNNSISRNTSPSRLPSLPSKSHAPSFKSESMQLPKSRTKPKGALSQSTSLKIDRQTTNIVSKARLPALGPTANDIEQKRQSEYQRRQIYALNQLMRELEQEKFRQFFKPDESNDTAPAEVVVNTEDPQPPPST